MKQTFKKIALLMLISSFFFSNMNVYAVTTSKWKTDQNKMSKTTEGILESEVEITEFRDESGKKRKEYIVTYTIPENFDGDTITIVPNGFINNCSMPGDDDIFNIKIVNQSKNKYHYVDDSFILSTEDFDVYSDSEIGKPIVNAYTFTGSKIREQIGFYRTKNTALQSLYGVDRTSKITATMLQDSEIDKVLDKEKYPNGSADLNQYYLDFYNEKYQTSAKKLEDLPTKAIAELFNGNYTKSFKETNQEVIELAYNFLYNKLLAFTFDSSNINDENSEIYSVGSYMRKEASYEIANKNLNENLKDIEQNTTKTITMPHVYINGRYMTNIYQNYYIGFYLEMKLKKDEVKPDDDKKEDPTPDDSKDEEIKSDDEKTEDNKQDDSITNDEIIPANQDYPLPPNTNYEG